MQSGRDTNASRRNGRRYVLGSAFASGLEHRLGHFFHEQGNAIGALDYIVPDIRGDELIADDTVRRRARPRSLREGATTSLIRHAAAIPGKKNYFGFLQVSDNTNALDERKE